MQLDSLRTRVERSDALIEVVRGANTSLDPHQVAAWLVWQAGEWLPAPCWAVVVPDVDGGMTVLGQEGLTPELHPLAWTAATQVVVRGAEVLSGDLSTSYPGAVGSVVALPLISRGRPFAVLVALDPLPSTTAPSLGEVVAAALRTLLEPIAIALDNALSFQKAEALSITDDLTGLSVQLTASVGIATLPDVPGSAEDLLKAADQAMYKVKNSGKNGIHVAEGNI
jgi:GAF domain-containing protein